MRICFIFRSGASSVNAIVICTPLCFVRMSGIWFFRMSDAVFILSMTHFLPFNICFNIYVQTHKKRLTVWSRTWCSLSTLDLRIWILQLTLLFLFQLPLMPGLFYPLALYVFQSNKSSHIQTAGTIKFVWFFHFEVYNLRFDFCKIALPHDRFKLSTLVRLEGPLTLLLALVINNCW